ncbi:MAG: hypothetical protein ACI31G_01970 [Bacilli bacterium]
MKKLRNSLFLFVAILSIASCSKNNKIKYQLPKVDEGQLIEIDGSTLFDLAITNSENVVCLFKIDNCSSCSYAFEQTEQFCKKNYCVMYTINIGTTTEEQYNKIVEATTYIDDLYAFKEYGSSLELPIAYFFLEQTVVYTVSENFVDFYLKNIEII